MGDPYSVELKNWKKVDKDMNVLQEDLTKVDHWLFPLHSGNHWHLLDVDISNKNFKSYNSLKGKRKHDTEVRRWVSISVLDVIITNNEVIYIIVITMIHMYTCIP